MNKKYFLYAIVPVIALASFGAVAFASQTNNGANPMSDIVSKIAKKFNLQEKDVQAVFDEHRTEMQAKMQGKRTEKQEDNQQKFADALKKAVADGKLTQAQADLVTAKRVELVAKMKTFFETTKTQQEIKDYTTQMHKDLNLWATANNIPQEYVKFLGLGFGGGKMGRGMGGFNPQLRGNSQK
jgi:hypothetical protein